MMVAIKNEEDGRLCGEEYYQGAFRYDLQRCLSILNQSCRLCSVVVLLSTARPLASQSADEVERLFLSVRIVRPEPCDV